MKKRLFAIAMAVCLMFPAAVYAQPAESRLKNEVVIYHTNDTHGYLSGDGESVIGIDQVAGLKESTPGAILVDAGDATQGQPLLAGAQEGNNGCHTVVERDGLKIGFFGLTTVETATSTNPEGIHDLEFEDEVETAKKEIDELEAEGVDAVIAVCHMGNTDSPCTSEDLANAMTGSYEDKIDVIIDGHSHTTENTEVNGTLIVQGGANMAGIGKLTLQISGSDVTASEELLSPADLSDVTPDPEVAERLAQIQEKQAGLLKTELGSTETTLWAGLIGGGVAVTRLVETNYGDFVADAFRYSGEAFMETAGAADADIPVIAVENGGGIRAGVANGVSVPKTGDGSTAVAGVIAVMALCCSAGAAAVMGRKRR